MNPNDVISQLQAQQQQFLNQQQHWAIGFILLDIALLLIVGLVIYAFYARLAGIEDELRKFRIAYEFANAPGKTSRGSQDRRGASILPESAGAFGEAGAEAKYMPKQ